MDNGHVDGPSTSHAHSLEGEGEVREDGGEEGGQQQQQHDEDGVEHTEEEVIYEMVDGGEGYTTVDGEQIVWADEGDIIEEIVCGEETQEAEEAPTVPNDQLQADTDLQSQTSAPLKRRGRPPNRDGVKRGKADSGAVVRRLPLTPKVLPDRAARVKSFRELENGECLPKFLQDNPDPDAPPGTVTQEDPEPFQNERTRPARRVFVENPFHAGTHLDWPIYSYETLPWSKISHIIMTEASKVPSNQTCSSVPQEFTEVGCFVVDLRKLPTGARPEITEDSLGKWGRPSGSARYFDVDIGGKIIHGTPEQYHTKINCNRYKHPGTEEQRGHFSKKIYVGSTRRGEQSTHAIIMYEWEGSPHPITVEDDGKEVRGGGGRHSAPRPSGQRSWEASKVDLSVDPGASWNGQPLFSRYAIDFESVVRIFFGRVDIQPHRLCNGVPMDYRQTGTFVVEVNDIGGENFVGKDQLKWGKPSGSARFFRYNGADESFVRIEGETDGESADVKIQCKRYDSDVASLAGFVRKIYTCKEKDRAEARVNTGLAVIVYMWKGDPFDPLAQAHKQFDPAPWKDSGKSVDTSKVARGGIPPTTFTPLPSSASASRSKPMDASTFSAVPLPHLDHLKRLSLAKELDNQNRLTALLERAEAFLDRFEQSGQTLGLAGLLGGVNAANRPATEYIIQTTGIGIAGTQIWGQGGNGAASGEGGGRGEQIQLADAASQQFMTANGETVSLPPGSFVVYQQ